jgi:hypothetical protein
MHRSDAPLGVPRGPSVALGVPWGASGGCGVRVGSRPCIDVMLIAAVRAGPAIMAMDRPGPPHMARTRANIVNVVAMHRLGSPEQLLGTGRRSRPCIQLVMPGVQVGPGSEIAKISGRHRCGAPHRGQGQSGDRGHASIRRSRCDAGAAPRSR